MPDEPTQDQDKAPELEPAAVAEPEPAAAEEARPGKKSKAAKKKAAAESLPEEEPAVALVAEPLAPPAVALVAELIAPPAVAPVAELIAPPAVAPVAAPLAPPVPEPVVTKEKIDQAEQVADLFQQGIQSILRWEYDAADNFFRQALTHYRQNGDHAGQIDVLEQLGHLCYLRGAEAQAREYYQQAGLMRNA